MRRFVVGRVWWASICPLHNNMLIRRKYSFVVSREQYVVRGKVNNLYEILKCFSHQDQNFTTAPSLVA